MPFEKPPLFRSTAEFAAVAAFLLLILAARLWVAYGEYRGFTATPFYYTDALVLSQMTKTKQDRTFEVLKLRTTSGMEFYTAADQKSNLTGWLVRVRLEPDDSLSFTDYLGAPYIKATVRSIKEPRSSPQSTFSPMIDAQHEDPAIASFYRSIFLATALPYDLRERIASLGVSHLVALSGFHLGILWGVLFGVLHLLYRPMQQRYFPYRYSMIDLGFIAIAVLGLYVWSVGAPPSLVRSYAMLIVGWVALVSGIELLSFSLLWFTALLLLAFFPPLLVSIGFWLSVGGVYYIFLILRYSGGESLWRKLVIIPFGIYILMLPVVHSFFGTASLRQLASPFLSLLFAPFYPAAIAAHLIGYGDIFDGALRWLFGLKGAVREITTPLWRFYGYLLISLAAMRYRWAFIVTIFVALGFAGYVYGSLLFI